MVRRDDLLQRRDQGVGDGAGCSNVDRAGEDVVARLRRVDVVVGMHISAESLRGQGGDHLVGVHVARGAGAGLVDVDRELVVVLATRHFLGHVVNGGRDVAVDDAQLAVDAGCSALDGGQCPDQRWVDRDSGEREVLNRTLGLCAPECPRRHADLAHRVVFDSELIGHERMVTHLVRREDAAPLSAARSFP